MNELTQILIPLGGILLSVAIVGGVLHVCRWLTEPTAWHCLWCQRDFDRQWQPVKLDNPLVASAAMCPECSEHHDHSLRFAKTETTDGHGWTQIPSSARN